MTFNVIKRKLICLIERIKLSESDYMIMKSESQMYKSMMSAIKCGLNTDYEDIKINDCIIQRIPKSKTMVVNVDVWQMLANGGIIFDKNTVKLNVIN